MIHPSLIHPRSIVVVGGTDNLSAPGGRLVKNLLDHGFDGPLYVVNPKKQTVQGLRAYPGVKDLPGQVDLAIIAVAAPYVEDIVRTLTEEKGTRAFIIISAGFSDAGPEGKALEERIVRQIDKVGGTLLGPNNIGLINTHYAGVFTTPVPPLSPDGIDLISGSGATAVFIMETAVPMGLRFNSVWTVGNAAQTGVEDILEYFDETYGPEKAGKVIMIYAETVKNPQKWLRHARSLSLKGIHLVGIKAGASQSGSRAAQSHTGAMATPDTAVDALFRKAGILRTYGRLDMIYRAGILTYPLPRGKRIGIVTHAGGPAVMLTDELEKHGLQVPEIIHPKARELREQYLYPGSSVRNPIDILATGTAEQLEKVLEYTVKYFDVDAIPVIFGSPGLFPVDEAYEVIHRAIEQYDKPVYPIMPSLINTAREMEAFRRKGHMHFTDEVMFGRALGDTVNRTPLFDLPEHTTTLSDSLMARLQEHEGFLPPELTDKLLQEAGIPVIESHILLTEDDIDSLPPSIFPAVMKVVGPLHKSDSGGVRLNVPSPDEARRHFRELMTLPQVTGVLVQPMIDDPREMFAGIKKEEGYGHLMMLGKGGVTVEVDDDRRTLLLPAGRDEIAYYLQQLRIHRLLEGYRHLPPVDKEALWELYEKLSALARALPRLEEMDLNPIMFHKGKPVVVDARISLGKE